MRYLVVLLLLFSAGCGRPPASIVPLCESEDVRHDARLNGEWRPRSGDPKPNRKPLISFGSLEDITVSITSNRDAGYTLTLRRDENQIALDGTLTRLGDSDYLTLRQPAIQDAALGGTTLRPYFLTKCTIGKDEIRLTGCHSERFQEVLQQAELPHLEADAGLVFTGTTEALRTILEHHEETLFPTGRDDLILIPAEP